MFKRLRERARIFKAETYVLYLAMRHPDTPWYAKIFIAAIVAYAFSPVDLIPDFLPVIGQLDDIIIVAVGFAVAFKMIPQPVLAECRLRAQEKFLKGRRIGFAAAAVVVIIWLAAAVLCVMWAYEAFSSLKG